MTDKEINPLLDFKCLNQAVSHFGNKSQLAIAMKTSAQNVNNWIIKGTIPTTLALQVERMSGGKIKARDILIENEALDMAKV